MHVAEVVHALVFGVWSLTVGEIAIRGVEALVADALFNEHAALLEKRRAVGHVRAALRQRRLGRAVRVPLPRRPRELVPQVELDPLPRPADASLARQKSARRCRRRRLRRCGGRRRRLTPPRSGARRTMRSASSWHALANGASSSSTCPGRRGGRCAPEARTAVRARRRWRRRTRHAVQRVGSRVRR